jgi:hypothetical protein
MPKGWAGAGNEHGSGPSRGRAAMRHGPCFAGMAHDSGERRLMLAVLEDAIRTLLVAKRIPVPLKRLRHDVAWIESSARDMPFAFESICDALGFDPSYLRRRLLDGGFVPPMGNRRRVLRRAATPRSRLCLRTY